MKRFSCFVVGAGVVALLCSSACNKPSAEDCQTAIHKMEQLLGTDSATRGADKQGEIRRCQGGSSREAVACAIKANTLDELKACEFMSKKKTN